MPNYAEIFNKNTDDMSPEEIDSLCETVKRYEIRKSIAKNKAEEEFYLKQERLKIQLQLNASIPDYEYGVMADLLQKQQEKKQDASPNYCVFVTVSPKNGSFNGFNDLRQRVEKCVSKHWVTDYAYCYEQRKTEVLDYDNPLQGLHAHMLIKKNAMTPKHITREITSTLKSLKYECIIDFKWKKKEWIPDKIDYMRGNKDGEGKLEKTLVDKTMRTTLGITDIITFSEDSLWSQY